MDPTYRLAFSRPASKAPPAAKAPPCKTVDDQNAASNFSPSAFEYDIDEEDEVPPLTCRGYESDDDEVKEKKQEPFRGYSSASMPWNTALHLAKSLGCGDPSMAQVRSYHLPITGYSYHSTKQLLGNPNSNHHKRLPAT